MFKYISKRLNVQQEKRDFKTSMTTLVDETRIGRRFVVYTLISGMIAALGIIMNNITIMIGAMLIAPLLTPVIGLSVGVGSGSTKLVSHSIKALVVGFVLAFVGAYSIAWLTHPTGVDRALYRTFSESSLYGLVAFLSGIIAIYNWLSPRSNNLLPGVTIAVALVPPLSFLGVETFMRNQNLIIDLSQLIFINLTGIFLGGVFTFLIYVLISPRTSLEVGEQVDEELEKNVKKD